MEHRIILSEVCWMFWVLCTLVLLALSVGMYGRLRTERRSKSQLMARLVALEGQLSRNALGEVESRLNPHLFKNILNSLQSHAFQTYHTLDKLAFVLDYILYESQRRFVSPREEADFALNLIEINKIKLSPLFDLKVQFRMAEGEAWIDEPLLVPMVSTDLIENAFKHTDIQSADAFMTIALELSNHCFSMRVANKISSKEPLKKQRSGVGNQSLMQRLQAVYGKHYSLERSTEGDVYVVNLKINLLAHQNTLLVAR